MSQVLQNMHGLLLKSNVYLNVVASGKCELISLEPTEELLALRLATIHNLHFIHNLMGKIRSAILDGTFSAFKDNFLASYQPTDEQMRVSQKQKWLKSRTAD